MTDATKLIERLKEAARAATPQNLDTAQEVERYNDGRWIECPTCGGEGGVELRADFCNYDGHALGVQFYGIGPEHKAAEAYFRVASPATILELIALIEQQAAALEAANARIAELEADRDAMPIPDAGAPIEGHWASAMADPLEVPGYIRAALAQPLEAQADELSLRVQYEDACIAANKNARDAERYRWLRDFNVRCKDGVDVKPPCEHVFASMYSHAVGSIPATRLVTGEELDRAIDAALSQKAGE